MSELVHLSVDDQIATITLDSEHNRNALSKQLVSELAAHLAAAEADPDSRVILIRSAHRVFCSGADLSEASGGGMADGAAALVALQRQIASGGKPVVVELGGPVRAGGLGIVGAADMVIAADTVTFQLTEVRLGLAPAVISLTLLPRLSDRVSADLFLTARSFDAAEAQSIGLVTKAVPESALHAEVTRVLGDLVKGYPQGLRETKKLLNHDLIERIDALGGQVADQSAKLFASEEAREAMAAFLSRGKSAK